MKTHGDGYRVASCSCRDSLLTADVRVLLTASLASGVRVLVLIIEWIQSSLFQSLSACVQTAGGFDSNRIPSTQF